MLILILAIIFIIQHAIIKACVVDTILVNGIPQCESFLLCSKVESNNVTSKVPSIVINLLEMQFLVYDLLLNEELGN
jgi:hypothetical protein